MEVRPNSVPDTPFVTGSEVDSYVRGGQRSVDIGPDTDRESSIERLIKRRKQRLQDDRENLKDHLHSYIELRSVQRWNPPRYTAYLAFADRLKSFASWPRRTELPTPESLAEAGFLRRYVHIVLYNY